MRDEQQEQPRSVFAPYVNERHCSNCTRYNECWAVGTEVYFPAGFHERERWSLPRVSDYMKRIYGGICGDFVMHPVNVELNKKDIQGWDK